MRRGVVVWLAACLAVLACRAPERALGEAELAAMIDSLLPSIAEASGLEVLRPVAFGLQSRADARAYVERQLDEQMAELRPMSRAYAELGLLPDTLDLRALLLELYTEQVVGYYDPVTGRLYVVEGIPAATAAPVVAHELVHALQDQHTDLEALVAPQRGNDRQMAAQAAAEGQATLVMIALQSAEAAGRPIEPGALPDLGPLLRPALEAEHGEFPVFARAPRLIRETLLFPYLHGATFVQALYRYRPAGADPPIPFGDLLPTSTQQVIHPVDRFIMVRAEPIEARFAEPGGGWAIAYDNTLGQFELTILLTEYLGEGAGEIAHPWAGDRYALLDGPAGETALVWYTVWETGAAADRFATRYRQVLEGRADRIGRVMRLEHEGRPLVLTVEARAGQDLDAVPVPGLRSLEPRPEL
jgi:hypothetical protein